MGRFIRYAPDEGQRQLLLKLLADEKAKESNGHTWNES